MDLPGGGICQAPGVDTFLFKGWSQCTLPSFVQQLIHSLLTLLLLDP